VTSTKCKNCGGPVGKDTKLCPHCGRKNPTGGLSDGVKMFLALAATILLVSAIPQMIAEHHGPIVPKSVQIAINTDASTPAPTSTPAPIISKFSSDQVTRGQSLHEEILAKYPRVDALYKKAYLWGALTEEPLSVISVPVDDWKALSEEQRIYLEAYAASRINAIRSSPFDFLTIPSDAPAAPIVLRKVSNMTADSWGIMVGTASLDGHAIMAEYFAIKGFR